MKTRSGFECGFAYASDVGRLPGQRGVGQALRGVETMVLKSVRAWHGSVFARNYLRGMAAAVIGEGA